MGDDAQGVMSFLICVILDTFERHKFFRGFLKFFFS